jgi:alanyl aminopeptidase
VSEPTQHVALTAPGAACPSWLYPNDDERGYYRWSLPTASLRDLATTWRGALTPAERVALPGHTAALLEADALGVADFCEVLAGLAADDHPRVVADAARRIGWLHDRVVAGAGDELESAYARYARDLLAPVVEKIGVAPRSKEVPAVKLLRAAVLPVAARVGRDAAVVRVASAVTGRFLAAPASVDEESVALFLPLAARAGDASLWEQLVARLSGAAGPSTPSVRGAIVRALGSFDDPVLVERSLGLVLDGRLRARDFRTLTASFDPRRAVVVWRWIAKHHDVLRRRLDPMTARSLPLVASRLCSEAAAVEVEADVASFDDPAHGTSRNLALALEDIEQCAGLRARARAPLEEWLEGHSRTSSRAY